MRKIVVLAVGAMMAAAVASGAFGAGVAAAKGPNLSGQTYSQASAKVASWGSKAVISSVVGDQLAMDNCVVTGSNTGTFRDSSGKKQSSEILLDLNCDASLAEAGTPGISAASALGRKEKKELKSLAWYGNDPSRCDAKNIKYCKTLCDKYSDKCSAGLRGFLASA
jgi:hypothetical protein